jgi:hypothetical protein
LAREVERFLAPPTRFIRGGAIDEGTAWNEAGHIPE